MISKMRERPQFNNYRKLLLGCERVWTPIIYIKSFDMDSVQVGKAEFVKESYTTLGKLKLHLISHADSVK